MNSSLIVLGVCAAWVVFCGALSHVNERRLGALGGLLIIVLIAWVAGGTMIALWTATPVPIDVDYPYEFLR